MLQVSVSKAEGSC